MIAHIKGEVIVADVGTVVLLTESGVGYEVNSYGYHRVGEKVSLFISHIVRETEQSLYGFLRYQEKKLFELLITVNKVGPKSAFVLLSTLGAAQLCEAVAMEDAQSLCQAKGVGKAAANQIILSLKDKLANTEMLDSSREIGDQSGDSLTQSHEVDIGEGQSTEKMRLVRDAVSALCELGFKEGEVLPAIKQSVGTASNVEDLVRSVLRQNH